MFLQQQECLFSRALLSGPEVIRGEQAKGLYCVHYSLSNRRLQYLSKSAAVSCQTLSYHRDPSICSSTPVAISQSRTLQSDLDMICLPSGEKATEVTQPERPLSVCSAAPATASQSCTVRSFDPDTTYLLSSEKASELTLLEWPMSVCDAAPVAVSQSRSDLN